MNKFLATVAVGTLMALTVPGVAGAKGGGVVKKANGTCSAASSAKLKVKTDNARLQAEFEVDQNVVGSPWNVQITDNAVVVASGTKTTKAPSGSFTFKSKFSNNAGTDAIVATATNTVTAETCTASLSI